LCPARRAPLSAHGRLNENVRELAQMERRNALMILGEPGYVGRPALDVRR
jgi:hypothetical protein